MKYSALLISALAVLAKAVELTNTDYTVTEDQPFTITWTGSTDPVTIKLKTGASNDLKDVQTITSSGSSGSFTWTPKDLPSGTYAFEITDSSGDVNYSPQFSYQGTGAALSTSTSSTASSTASTTGSSSTSSETKSTTSSASLASSTMTPITNSTMSTSTRASTSRSSTATVTSSSSTSTATEIPNTNNGQRVASSLALVFGAVAAFVALN